LVFLHQGFACKNIATAILSNSSLVMYEYVQLDKAVTAIASPRLCRFNLCFVVSESPFYVMNFPVIPDIRHDRAGPISSSTVVTRACSLQDGATARDWRLLERVSELTSDDSRRTFQMSE